MTPAGPLILLPSCQFLCAATCVHCGHSVRLLHSTEITLEIDVKLPADLIDRLQAKSTRPPLETLESLLRRALDEHSAAYPSAKRIMVTAPPRQEPTHYRTSRGFELPIDKELWASYRSKSLRATVTASGIEYNGKAYGDPCAAAFQAKKDSGVSDTTASANGWRFGMMKGKVDGSFVSLDVLRRRA